MIIVLSVIVVIIMLKFIEMNKLLETLIQQYYYGMTNSDMLIAVFDLDGIIGFSTNKFASQFGESHFSANLRPVIKKQLHEVQPEVATRYIQIRKQIQTNKTEAQYLMNVQLIDGIHCFLVNHRPIFAPDASVIGTELHARIYYLFPINQLIQTGESIDQKISSSHIHLTLRQKQIIFYLIIGLTQENIARILKISRGTVVKMIANDICPKFNLVSGSATFLVKEILKYDFKHIIPDGILNVPKLILIG